MMQAAAEAAAKAAADFAVARPLCLGVTVLTSLDRRSLQMEVGVSSSVGGHVLHLATLSREAGLDGSVASPEESRLLRAALGRSWIIVTPGIRLTASRDDQKRTATPTEAVAAGADYIVVGRSITAAPDPVAVARRIVDDLARSG
jgi:orotidine-5'-phosphate decarboxylase